MAPPKETWIRRFVITETSRHKKDFTIYKVTSLMFLKTSPDIISKVSIWKRYSDFKRLHGALKVLYSTLQIKEPYPVFPKPKFFGRFEAEVIEERRQCALKLLEFIGRYNALFSSDAFVKFFDNDRLDKQLLDCSQSLSSDTSEDDRAANYANAEKENSNTTSLPKFVCSKKITPIIVKNKLHAKSSNVNCKTSSFKDKVLNNATDQNYLSSNNNDTKNNLNEIVNSSVTLTCKESNLSSNANNKASVGIHDGSDLTQANEEAAQYILIAAAHMSAAFRHEAIAEYEEAFTQYKLGISHLINGVETEIDQEKKIQIQNKITKYLQRAEKLYNRHLNCNVSVLLKPVTELRNYKVIELKESIMIVKDTLQGFQRVVKSVEKVADCQKENTYILRGKVPYMVQLYSCMQTESTVFLILQYMSRGRLWDFIKSNYKLQERRRHSRSFSCNGLIQNHPDSERCGREEAREGPSAVERNVVAGGRGDDLRLSDDTKEMVENAQRLLRSVSATLKRSNSIACRLNDESDRPLQESKSAKNFSRRYLGDDGQEIATKKLLPTLEPNDLDRPGQSQRLDNCPLEVEKQMWSIPEALAKVWAAQILLTLEALHQQDVVISDLRPENILMNDCGHVSMSYIVPRKDTQLLRLKKPYSSPELCMFTPPISMSPSADVWSFGVLLYELLTGFDFQAKHPGQFHSHSIVNIPNSLSEQAKSLLLSILKYQPSERLTIPEIKQHDFFIEIVWLELLNAQI